MRIIDKINRTRVVFVPFEDQRSVFVQRHFSEEVFHDSDCVCKAVTEFVLSRCGCHYQSRSESHCLLFAGYFVTWFLSSNHVLTLQTIFPFSF